MLRTLLRPVPLLLASALLLGTAAALAHAALATLAGDVRAEADARRALLGRIHALALERADRTAAFHRAVARTLAEGGPAREAAAREVGDGARALARRGRSLEAALAERAPILPPDERKRVREAAALVLERVDAAVRTAGALAEAAAPGAALAEADAAGRALGEALEAAEREIEGLGLRARARAEAVARRARRAGAGLAGAAVLLAAAALAFRAGPRGPGPA